MRTKSLDRDETEPVPARYCYRARDGETKFWQVFTPGVACVNSRMGHNRLIHKMNRSDGGRLVWKWDEVKPGDFDYPDFLGEE